MNALVPIAVCLPLVSAAFLVAILSRIGRRATEIFAIVCSFATLALCATVLRDAFVHGTAVLWFGDWHPGNTVGLGIAFVVDPAAAAVATFVATIVTAAVIFSRGYFDEAGTIFYALLFAMLGAMIAFAYAADAFDLFVFYEVFSVAAY
ncbi:MAG: NADH-quinone oxidoreductase subunit E, partial [Candidatus Eremiobacteraeota bacterium]|nr:NADH-quinone oxidoreductase subunit E [Candidatus Eremiobacteraeota bacterium]